MDNIDTGTTELLRTPKQKRSREKFDAILDHASRLIHEKGYDHVSVREIARSAGLPIASVYQYFPNRLSIVRHIWERYTGKLGDLMSEQFSEIPDDFSEKDMARWINNVIDFAAEHHRENPEFLDVWRVVDGAPELRVLNHKDTLEVAEMITTAVRQINPKLRKRTVMDRALIVAETASATIKFAQELDERRQRSLIKELKTVLVSILSDLV